MGLLPKHWVRDTRFTTSTTRIVAIIAVISALNIATNYVLLPLSNVKLMDAMVFLTGYLFGLTPGLAVATLTWTIYGTLNPLGFSLATLVVVTLAEFIYAVLGAALSKSHHRADASLLSRGLLFGVVGLLSTLTYDVATNAVVGWLFYGSPLLGLLTMNFPMPLALAHEVSNTLLFATLIPVLIRELRKTIAREAI
jgi:hypothetical protein